MISIYNRFKSQNSRVKIISYGHLWALMALITIATSCGIYKLNGARIPLEVKTISIGFFQNQAELVNPTLSQDFTDELRDRFLSQTRLSQVNFGADWEVTGAIVNYYEKPMAANANTAALNKLTISVRVEFVDNFNEKNSWKKTFTRSQVYDGTLSLSDVEEELTKDINDQLVNDIFTKIAVNW